jgi:hypothetical protein
MIPFICSASLGKARACTHYLACKGRVKPQPAHCVENGLSHAQGEGEEETSRWRAASSATSMPLGAGMDSGGFEMPFSSSKKCLRGFTLSNFALLRCEEKYYNIPSLVHNIAKCNQALCCDTLIRERCLPSDAALIAAGYKKSTTCSIRCTRSRTS